MSTIPVVPCKLEVDEAMRLPLILLTIVATSIVSTAQAGEKTIDELVAGAPETISTGHKFTEGPAWHPDGYLVFSDIPNAKIHKVAADGQVSVWWGESGGTNGLMCTTDGVLYGCQNRSGKMVRLQGGPAGARIIAEEFQGKPLNSPNDLAIDEKGGLYFTDPVYGDRPQPQPVQGVYYIANDGVLSRVIDDIPRPNGVNVSNDGRTLFVADANNSRVLKYEIKGPGELGEAEVFFQGDVEKDGHGPDGMALDQFGNLYATMATTVVISPSGKRIGEIATETKPANCTFGGAENKTLFITGRDKVFSVPMHVAGQPLRKVGPRGPRIASNTPARTFFVFDDAEPTVVKLRDLSLSIPADWKTTPSASRMRLATYRVPAADGDELDTDYVVFPPMGGSTQANVERWIGQFQGADKKITLTQGKTVEGTYVLADIEGTYNMPIGPPIMRKSKAVPNCRMLAAIFTVKNGGSYYLKMAGPKATVDAAAEGFRSSFNADTKNETEYKLD